MRSLVLDTHVLVWYLEGNQAKLSSHAIHLIDSVIAQSGTLYIPSICIVELIYLAERKRIHHEFLIKLEGELTKPNSVFLVSSLNQNVALAMQQIPRDVVPDMPDRVIAATALHLNTPLITYDEKISKVNAIVCLR
ncbi:MAG: PIN domain-containing protein [Anaerolineae bacterium]|nr:PIN domain-containing protein [Anaerolineae bacterium]